MILVICSIQGKQALTVLDVGYTNIKEEDASTISEMLKVEVINLQNNELRSGIESICSSMKDL